MGQTKHVRTVALIRASATVVALMVAQLALASSVTATASPPKVRILKSPELFVATKPSTTDRPYAWVLFRTATDVNARLFVAQVHGHSGRSYKANGARCIRSTLVVKPDVPTLRRGDRYKIRIYSRAGLGSKPPRRLLYTATLVAHSFERSRGHTQPQHCT